MLRSFARSGRLALVPAFVLAVVVLSVAGPAHAAGQPQQVGGVAGGIYNWYTLAAGGSVEWVFHYPGSDNAALIAFGVDPANSIAVNVYDDGQWRALGAGNRSIVPVGRGTSGTAGAWSGNQDLITNGKLFWEAGARPAVIFHIQVINTMQGPARYWIAEAGPGAGELTPYIAVAAAAPTAQPAAAGQALSAGTGAPPPQTLPISGRDALLLSFGAGLALVLAGWVVRRRSR
jgi:hypothetical protein